MTRLKLGIKEKGGDCSNVSKTIIKQGLERFLGYGANLPMTIGKSDFEGGVATCAQQCKRAYINKRKPAGRLHAEKN